MLFFENLNRDFGKLGIGIVQIGLQIWTRRPRIRLYANFGKFGCIISPENNQLARFFGHPVGVVGFRSLQFVKTPRQKNVGGKESAIYQSSVTELYVCHSPVFVIYPSFTTMKSFWRAVVTFSV